ncbi:MAG TPA: septal ring lytic transglycosylase RlpA family protein [Rhizomicrobium sp.]|nr:septal ring lytic transglycosylase RlpA family protein [Rhizomicrobium sp.]
MPLLRALRSAAAAVLLAVFVAACATRPSAPPPENHQVSVPSTAGVYKIGNPYQQDGIWYYPHEQPDYDETGVASWYGAEFHGQRTANGETFDSNALTAAHRTLPMPVNVRVTNLENGRSLIVRVNDRGPFARGRIIDVSARAAELLGFKNQGTARVRVTYMGKALLPGANQIEETPPEIATAVPAAPAGKVDMSALSIVPGAAAAPPVQVSQLPQPTPATLPPPQPVEEPVTGQVTQVQVPAVTHLYVQAGAFSTRSNAERLKTRLSAAGGLMISATTRNGQTLYRVRVGPFDELSAADAALARVVKLGSNDAQIVVDQ